MISLDVTLDCRDDAVLVAPLGLSTPDVAPVSLGIRGGSQRVVFDPGCGQGAVEVVPKADHISFRWQFSRGGADYPEAMFTQRDSRYTRALEAQPALFRGAGAVGVRDSVAEADVLRERLLAL